MSSSSSSPAQGFSVQTTLQNYWSVLYVYITQIVCRTESLNVPFLIQTLRSVPKKSETFREDSLKILRETEKFVREECPLGGIAEECENNEYLSLLMMYFLFAEIDELVYCTADRESQLNKISRYFIVYGTQMSQLARSSDIRSHYPLTVKWSLEFLRISSRLEEVEAAVESAGSNVSYRIITDESTKRRDYVIQRKSDLETLWKQVEEFEWSDNFSTGTFVDHLASDDVCKFTILLATIFLIDTICRLETIFEESQLLRMRKSESEKKAAHSSTTLKVDGTGAVLDRPFAVKIRNQAELQKYFQSRVFQPGHALPTISIEECARIEMKTDLRNPPKQRRKDSETGKSIHSSDEEEDDPARVEAKELKERSWDDWKDHNPRGSGNKNINVG